MPVTLIILIVLSLIFDLTNGIRDSSNIVATMITSRAMSPRWALTITAIAEFAGPFIFGVALAKTIGDEIVVPGSINMSIIIAALVSAILMEPAHLVPGITQQLLACSDWWNYRICCGWCGMESDKTCWY